MKLPFGDSVLAGIQSFPGCWKKSWQLFKLAVDKPKFKPFLLILNLFQWLHDWNQQKTSETEQKKWCLSTPQSWSTCKSWSTPWGGTSNLSFLVDFFDEELFAALKSRQISRFCSFSDVFCWFLAWNHWTRFKMNKQGWKRLKKVVRPAFGCVQHPKDGRNTQHEICLMSGIQIPAVI